MVKDLVIFPDLRLRHKSHKVRAQNKDYIKSLIQDLKDTAESHSAYGLSAIQIGVPLRVMVVQDNNRYIALVNPEVTIALGAVNGLESCLSLPGYAVEVSRPNLVRVVDRYNNKRYGFLDTQARIFCHEQDHFLGTLIVDYQTDKASDEAANS